MYRRVVSTFLCRRALLTSPSEEPDLDASVARPRRKEYAVRFAVGKLPSAEL